MQGDPKSEREIKKINNEPYRLRANDILLINIKSAQPELVSLFKINDQNETQNNNITSGFGYMNGYSVDHHGNIRLPYLGEVNVLGYTTKEIRIKLEDLLKKYFKNKDDFFVDVKLNGIRYTVIGEVKNPGQKVIYENQINIYDAISNAGDLLITGDRKHVELLRFNSSGYLEKYVIDLTTVSAVNSESFFIKPNDLINIKPLKQKSWGLGTTGLGSLTTIISIFSLITSTILVVRSF